MKITINSSDIDENILFATYVFPESNDKKIIFKLARDDNNKIKILSSFGYPQNQYIN